MKSLVLIVLILCFDVSNSKNEQINVLGGRLEKCSTSPMTGYYRSGIELLNEYCSMFLS